MSKPNVRTNFALVAVGLLALAAVTAGVVAYAVSKAPKHYPELTVFANGESVVVEPYGYCELSNGECVNDESTYYIPATSGKPVQVSLPTSVAEAPWIVVTVYERPNGEQFERILSFIDYPAETRFLSLDTQPEPELRLAGFEVRLPIVYTDPATGQEMYDVHGLWRVGTPQP
ncbi:DUF2771 family protein [Nocardia coubleae]|uniref:DUF2771 domain-containing protein n=1 Tax=Nocardia coubleae TaxID=356147 RepID=A0A846W6G8_9NOCA|nr:DUF2771 family protein [Nocardia coubleae]NKX88892.1 DUF2771 domain-containing protein [Nocardia coubleae]